MFIVSLYSFLSSSIIRGTLVFTGCMAAQNKSYNSHTLLQLTSDEWDINVMKLLARNFLKRADTRPCLSSSFPHLGTQNAHEMLDLPSWTMKERRPHPQGSEVHMGGKAAHLVGFWEAESQWQYWAARLLHIFISKKYHPVLFKSLLFWASVACTEFNTN